jgi:flagellar motor switch protein FliG
MDGETSTVEISTMTKVQKLAALLVILGPESAAQIVTVFDEREMEMISLEMSRLPAIPPELQRDILQEFADVALPSATGAPGEPGFATVALEKSAAGSRVTGELDCPSPSRQPVAAASPKIFAFEELALLDSAALQKIMRTVDMRDLAVALKAASPQLKSALFASLSKRTAGTVTEEMTIVGPVKKQDIEAAQARIMEAVLQLEAGGEIDLSNAAKTARP